MRITRSALLLLILLIPPVCLDARIIEIPQDCPTIQDGIHASDDGDTVLVAPGLYYENIRFHGKRILLTSYLDDRWPRRSSGSRFR